MLSQILAVLADDKLNVEDMVNRHRDGIAYNIIDLSAACLSDDTMQRLNRHSGCCNDPADLPVTQCPEYPVGPGPGRRVFLLTLYWPETGHRFQGGNMSRTGFRRGVALPILALIFATMNTSCQENHSDLKNGLYAEFETDRGNILVELYPERVPLTVMNFVGLAEGDLNFANKKGRLLQRFNLSPCY